MKLKYSYIIYKVYSWFADVKNDIPITKTILILAVVHFFNALTIIMYIDKFITIDIEDFPRTYMYIGAVIYFLLFYLSYYNKKRWDTSVSEYSKECEKNRKRGNVFVAALLLGSIVFFFMSLPITGA